MVFRILIFLFLVQLVFQYDLTQLLKLPAEQLHQACVIKSQQSQSYQNEMKALICGQPLKDKTNKTQLSQVGLFHMFVVSGAHLSFYRKFFYFILPSRLANWAQILFLMTYTMTCLFSAPLLRAGIEFSLNQFSLNQKLNWTSEQTLLITGMICIILKPVFFDGLSLPLSWIAALCLCQKGIATKIFTLFLALYPLLLFFYLPNPLSAVVGFFFTSLISFVLLPLNLLSFFIPPFNYILKNTYDFFYSSIDLIAAHIPNYPYDKITIHRHWVWVYLLGLNICLIYYQRAKKIE